MGLIAANAPQFIRGFGIIRLIDHLFKSYAKMELLSAL